ncbi:high-potential iron-sulfur protein [Zhongshania sp.]|uniref:high-potential iron-sulfur protein n=1 Tax=Zhongshania sp. TaxID=1971902 RepID=UPI0035690DDF
MNLLVGGAGIVLGNTALAESCFDMAKLPMSDRNLRKSLNFIAVSTDSQKSCGGCAFFKATQTASCGTCMMFSGGGVAAESLCDSWVAKA